MLLFIQAHHRTVHPRLVFRHKGQIRTGILKDHREQTVAEHEVALYQQGIVFLQLFLHDGQGVDVVRLVVDGVLCEFDMECCMPGVDIIHQLLAFISHHDDDSLQLEFGQLSQQTVYQRNAVHRNHTLGVLFGEFS